MQIMLTIISLFNLREETCRYLPSIPSMTKQVIISFFCFCLHFGFSLYAACHVRHITPGSGLNIFIKYSCKQIAWVYFSRSQLYVSRSIDVTIFNRDQREYFVSIFIKKTKVIHWQNSRTVHAIFQQVFWQTGSFINPTGIYLCSASLAEK